MPRPGCEFLTSNAQIAYPIRDDAVGLATGNKVASHDATNAILPIDFLLDAIFYTPADVTELYLSELRRVGNIVYLQFVKGDLTPVITYPYDTVVEVNKQVLTLCEVGASLRLLKGSSFDIWLSTLAATDNFGLTLPMESSVVDPKSAALQSIQIYSDPVTPVGSPIIGDITFQAGYNMHLDTDAINGVVTITAAAGEGEGRIPCADQPTIVPVKAPMQLVPDTRGNVRIAGDSCISVVPMPALDAVQLQGNCFACCTCADYVAVGNALKLLIARAMAVHVNYDALKENYNKTLVPDYETQYFPALRKLFGSMKLIHGAPASSAAHAYIAISIQNKSEDDAKDLVIIVAAVPAGATIIKATYSIGNTIGTADWTTNIPVLPKGESVTLGYFVTTGDPTKPLTSGSCILQSYKIGSRTYTNETIYNGPCE